MVFVHDHFGLKEETLYFSVMMMDRYSNKEKVEKNNYKLLGITCLFMAAKHE